MLQSVQISKLKSALESKESEVPQLKDYTFKIAMEVKNLRTASPLHLTKHGSNLKPEASQRPASDAIQIEVSNNIHQNPCLGKCIVQI